MEQLFDRSAMQEILERGLLSGKWSVLQFNKTGRDVVLPTKQFLLDHPEFQDMEFRDMVAFRRIHG
jgi:hypothetical protein